MLVCLCMDQTEVENETPNCLHKVHKASAEQCVWHQADIAMNTRLNATGKSARLDFMVNLGLQRNNYCKETI